MILLDATLSLYIEAISKMGFWFKVRTGSSFDPQAPEGSALGVNTKVFRGVETREQRRIWAKRHF